MFRFPGDCRQFLTSGQAGAVNLRGVRTPRWSALLHKSLNLCGFRQNIRTRRLMRLHPYHVLLDRSPAPHTTYRHVVRENGCSGTRCFVGITVPCAIERHQSIRHAPPFLCVFHPGLAPALAALWGGRFTPPKWQRRNLHKTCSPLTSPSPRTQYRTRNSL